MKTNKRANRSTIKELCGFGAGCLLGGLVGVAAGMWCRTELAVISSYGFGFTGGGILGAIITRRLTR